MRSATSSTFPGRLRSRVSRGNLALGIVLMLVVSIVSPQVGTASAHGSRAFATGHGQPVNCTYTVNGNSVTCTPPLNFHGGRVMHHPRIYLVFWGSAWHADLTQQNSVIQEQLLLFKNLAGSAYNNILTQYSDATDYVHNDAVLADWRIDDTDPVPSNVGWPEIFGEVTASFGNIFTPQWTNSPDTFVLVYPQQGTHLDSFGVDAFPAKVCGAHKSNGLAGTIYYFGMVRYIGDDTACSFGTTVPNDMARVAAHEYAEAVTDPDSDSALPLNGTGWYTDESDRSNDVEIGDLCNYDTIYFYTADISGQSAPGTREPIPVTYLWADAGDGSTSLFADNSPMSTDWCVYTRGAEYYNASAGKHTVDGSFLDAYLAAGAQWFPDSSSPETPSPTLGYPTNERYSITGGKEQDFQTGGIYAQTGASQVFTVPGPTYAEYEGTMKGPGGALGFPTTNGIAISNSYGSGTEQFFQGTSCGTATGSAIYWSAGTGAHTVQGCIYQEFVHVGGTVLGFPTQDEQPIGSGGRVSYFNGTTCGASSGSAIYSFSASGTHAVYGCIYQAYKAYGGPTSNLGFPTSDEYGISSGRESDFQGGYITFSSATGAVVHLYGSANPPSPSGTSVCAVASGPNLTAYCDVPTVTIYCGGAIGNRNDYSGVPINWTYTNGSTTCDVVTYSFAYSNGRNDCSYYIYVPNGFATTVIQATLSDGTPVSMNEDPVSGWQYWFDATGITSLTFTDGNGTTNQDMGWGSAASRSIERLCAL